ncbi:CotS family spore coat protein [Clostridium sp. DL1XJH146]
MTKQKRLSELSIPNKEENIIRYIMKKYDYNIIEILKIRSAYKIKTDKGNLCLKKYCHGKNKAKNGFVLVNELKKNGFNNTANYIKTTNDKYYVKYKDYFFYVTEWINGNEVNIDDFSEVLNCVELLAKFHNSSGKIEIKKLKLKSNFKNWYRIYNSKLYDFIYYKSCIKKKKIMNSFDTEYFDNIEKFYDRGILALNYLKNSSYNDLLSSKANVKTNYICHNSFYYQNIIKKDDIYYLIDLDSIVIDHPIVDLSKYINRIMDKIEYNWDFEKAKLILERYSDTNKISVNELDILLALIIFPHKYWKLGRKRYVKQKNWSEKSYKRKLKKELEKYDKVQIFIDDFTKYLNKKGD